MSNRCGEPNFANYGDCVVCGRTYEQIREISALTFLEATTTSNDTYAERRRIMEAFIAGMETGTVLLVPRGLSQTTACDRNYYQIPADADNTNPMQGVLPFYRTGLNVHGALLNYPFNYSKLMFSFISFINYILCKYTCVQKYVCGSIQCTWLAN